MHAPAAACAATLATVCLLAAGCRAVTGAALFAPHDAPALPASVDDERKASRAPRTIPIEVLFVRHAADDPAFGADLWRHVDEQALDADLRQRLESNGLRAGVVTGRLPPDVASRLEPAATVDPTAPESAGLHRTLRLLPGKRAEVVTATGLAEIVLLERTAAGVGGATFRDATALVALEAWPDADGRARVRIVPEVKHGAMQRSWVGEEGMFRLETGQSRRAFDDLGVTARLPPGGMLLVGVTDAGGAAVGDALLRDKGSADTARLLVVRPVGAAADPLFTAADAAGATDPADR